MSDSGSPEYTQQPGGSALKGQTGAMTPSAAASAANEIALAQYLATAPTLTDTQLRSLLLDARGNLLTNLGGLISGEDQTNNLQAIAHLPTPLATYAWSVSQVAALAASLVVKSGAGKLKSIKGRIDSTATAADYYIQILNAASLPANGTVTHLWPPQKVKGHVTTADDKFDIDFGAEGIFASTGIVIALSTTEFTLTIASAWLSCGAEYK